MAKWRCKICGWTCDDDPSKCPPEKCPKCGASKSQFIEL